MISIIKEVFAKFYELKEKSNLFYLRGEGNLQSGRGAFE